MTKRIRLGVALLAASLAVSLELAALADGQPNEAETITVTEKDSGTKIKLAKGDMLVVRLEFQGGTAFGWKIAKNDDKVLKAPEKPEIERPDKPKPGGKATQIFRFKAEAAGKNELELHYARPFDKDK